jgi:hypothetical protein
MKYVGPMATAAAGCGDGVAAESRDAGVADSGLRGRGRVARPGGTKRNRNAGATEARRRQTTGSSRAADRAGVENLQKRLLGAGPRKRAGREPVGSAKRERARAAAARAERSGGCAAESGGTVGGGGPCPGRWLARCGWRDGGASVGLRVGRGRYSNGFGGGLADRSARSL